MASRIKEDEKNEKIIRGLSRLPANKKCINCNSLGPQYVCTNFWTFICTNCSGIHREFTHRVKSVSMAKFTSQEVTALQEGGNERAKDIFFKEWDHQRHSFPDSSNVEKLRTFIKQVYIDRRYTGDRSVDKPQMGNKEDSYEQRRPETFRGSSRSPSYDDAFDRRSTGKNDDNSSRSNFDERRSPGYDRGDYRRSPGRIEAVDDRRRDDRFGKGNSNSRFDDRRVSDGKSPNHQRSVDTPSPPMVRPIRDILGEGAPSLVVGEPPKSNGSRIAESPSQSQVLKTTPSSSVISTPGANPSELKSVTTITTAEVKIAEPKSLIDFSADFDTPASCQQQSGPQQASGLPVDDGNWASFDSVTMPKPANITNSNPLESALSQLYAPGNTNTVSNTSTLPPVGQIPASHQNSSSLFATIASQSAIPQSVPQINPLVSSSNNQAWASAPISGGVGQITTSSGYASQPSIIPNAETRPGSSLQPQVTEAKPSERKELPADLFTLTYPMGAGAVPGWQVRPQYGMGFGMQYPTVMQVPSFPHASKPANPFDVSNESSLAHATTFPSMAPLQAALPTAVDPLGLLRSSSLGANPQWMAPQQLPNPVAAAPALGGGYMSQIQNSTGQQTSLNFLSSGNEAVGDVGLQRIPSGMPGTDQNLNAIYLQQSSNSFTPSSGNPFG